MRHVANKNTPEPVDVTIDDAIETMVYACLAETHGG